MTRRLVGVWMLAATAAVASSSIYAGEQGPPAGRRPVLAVLRGEADVAVARHKSISVPR